jgi:trigger factor
MKIIAKNTSETKVKLTIALDTAELAAAKQVALIRLSKDANIDGFRKGKAPIGIVEQRTEPQILQEKVIDNALNKAVAEAFMSENLQVLNRPSVELTKFVPEQVLEFTAEAEILPKVVLGNYKKLTAKRPKTTIKVEEVAEIIERVRAGYARKEEVTRTAKLGDEVTIDFIGKKDNEAFEGGTANNYVLKLGSNQFIPGFEDGIVGHKASETFDLELAFPKDYHAEQLKGAKVNFSITLKSVKKITLPEINDELAAKVGPFTSTKELKADIKRELTNQKGREVKQKLKDELVNELVEISEIPVPEILIRDQEKSIEQDFESNLSHQGLSLDKYLDTHKYTSKEQWLDKEVRAIAKKRVKTGLALSELAKLEKITLDEAEVDKQIEIYKKQYNKNKEALAQFDKPEVRRDIANQLIIEKTTERLSELNNK